MPARTNEYECSSSIKKHEMERSNSIEILFLQYQSNSVIPCVSFEKRFFLLTQYSNRMHIYSNQIKDLF